MARGYLAQHTKQAALLMSVLSCGLMRAAQGDIPQRHQLRYYTQTAHRLLVLSRHMKTHLVLELLLLLLELLCLLQCCCCRVCLPHHLIQLLSCCVPFPCDD